MILAFARVDAGEAASPDCTTWGLNSCPRPYDARIPDPKDMLTWTQPERVIGFRNCKYHLLAEVMLKDPQAN